MAIRLMDNVYVKGGYLDSNVSVTSLNDLIDKYDFDGQSIHMPEAFLSTDGVSYPVDFWYVPNGDDIKWEIKNVPAISSAEDFERFKIFCNEFKNLAGYYPIANGGEVLVDGFIYSLSFDENGNPIWIDKQEVLDETISDAIKTAVDEVTSGASEAFDTLKEIEDWINANSGSTAVGIQGPQGTQGAAGADGKDGADGAQGAQGPQGAQGEKGDQGEMGPQGADGKDGADGVQGPQGAQGEKGDQGEMGPQGADGKDGADGAQGPQGTDGTQGKSAYEIWLQSGNKGSEIDFLASLKGEKGAIDEESLVLLKKELYESATTYTDNKIAEIEIPSLEGYATETFVKNAIADAQLSGETGIDLSGYATKDDIKNLASKDDIKIYSSGTGISVVDNKINVLIESGDTENRNYIKVNEDNSLSVENIGLDDAITTEEIQVNGGAWASAIQDIYGDTIPVGTSFQDFLKAMSCKEYFVSNISVSSSFTVTCGDLKPELSGANSGDIVEVGTEVILKTINGTETKARQSITLSGFEYGYKLGENGNYINSKTYTENPIAIISGETGNKSLRVSFTKFASAINGGAISVKTGQNSIEQTTMYVQEGQNSVNIYQTGDTYSSNTNLTGGTLYIATNLKNYYKSDKSTPNTYVPTFPLMTKTATISNTYSITGARKYYIGDIKDYSTGYWNTDKSSIILGLEKQDWATENTITVPYTFKIGTKQQTVVVPAVYTNVSGKDANNGAVDFSLVKTITLTNSKGNNSQYNVFVAPAYDGLTTESLINITIKKS